MDASHPPPSNTGDDPFAVLSNEHCRHVVRYFRQSSEPVAQLDGLVEYSARLADDETTRDSHAIALHHVALPKLADAGVLDYDIRNNTVRYRGHPIAEQLVGRVTELEE